MRGLTKRQREVLEFVQAWLAKEGGAPSLREIAGHFGFRSMTAAADHVRALRRKGFLESRRRGARALRVASSWWGAVHPIANVPIYGSIPAGWAEERRQEEALGCVSIDIETLGIKRTSRTFALEVRGDSMIGRHIVDGDLVVLEHGKVPRSGDVVAALIDNQSTLKTLVIEGGKAHLRAENPRYPKQIPASDLVIQGVMVALIRRPRA